MHVLGQTECEQLVRAAAFDGRVILTSHENTSDALVVAPAQHGSSAGTVTSRTIRSIAIRTTVAVSTGRSRTTNTDSSGAVPALGVILAVRGRHPGKLAEGWFDAETGELNRAAQT